MKKILYFTAEWCGPCKTIKPQMQQLSRTLPIHFIDIDTNHTTCEQYSIRSVPCVVIIDTTGAVAGRIVGNNITTQSVTEMFNK